MGHATTGFTVCPQKSMLDVFQFSDLNMRTGVTYDPEVVRKSNPPPGARDYRIAFTGFRKPMTPGSYPRLKPKDRPPPEKKPRLLRGARKLELDPLAPKVPKSRLRRRLLLYDNDYLEPWQAPRQTLEESSDPHDREQSRAGMPLDNTEAEPERVQTRLLTDLEKQVDAATETEIGTLTPVNLNLNHYRQIIHTEKPQPRHDPQATNHPNHKHGKSEGENSCSYMSPNLSPPKYHPRPQFAIENTDRRVVRLQDTNPISPPKDIPPHPPPHPPFHPQPHPHSWQWYPQPQVYPPPWPHPQYHARSHSLPEPQIMPRPPPQYAPYSQCPFPLQYFPYYQPQPHMYHPPPPQPPTQSQSPAQSQPPTKPHCPIQPLIHHPSQWDGPFTSQLPLLSLTVSASSVSPVPATPSPAPISQSQSLPKLQVPLKPRDPMVELERLVAKYNKARKCVWNPDCTVGMYGYNCFSISIVEREQMDKMDESKSDSRANTDAPENAAASSSSSPTLTSDSNETASLSTRGSFPVGRGRTIYNMDAPLPSDDAPKKPTKPEPETKPCIDDVDKRLEILERLRTDYIGAHLFECHGIEIKEIDFRPIPCRPCGIAKAGGVEAAYNAGLAIDIPMSLLPTHLNKFH